MEKKTARRKANGVEPHGDQWAVADQDGGVMCTVREKRIAEGLLGCSYDGARFVRRVAVVRAVVRAVELRGLAQKVGTEGRRAAADSAVAALDGGHSAAWAIFCGQMILNWWNPSRETPRSVALAGMMP